MGELGGRLGFGEREVRAAFGGALERQREYAGRSAELGREAFALEFRAITRGVLRYALFGPFVEEGGSIIRRKS